MCTTYLALEVIKEFEGELDPIGYPRLVRLNPNIPWKTRGNGAICLRLARGRGPSKWIGEVKGRPVQMFHKGSDPPLGEGPRPKEVMERLIRIVERLAHLEVKGTNSAIVVTTKRPARGFYWQAVRDVIPIRSVKVERPRGALIKAYGTGRGAIGAMASISWVPRDKTYEILTYRVSDRWGTPRQVDLDDVRGLDKEFPSTFNNYDPKNRHAAIVPGSPCPILFGIRGDDPEVLPDAMRSIRSERKDRCLIFETNQGTDDHLCRRDHIGKYQSGIISGTVKEGPRDTKGGHVLFTFRGMKGGRSYTCAAYEPTKEFRNVVRSLAPGDSITLFASRGVSNPDTLNIEKLRVDGLVGLWAKVGNPICKGCGRTMRSVGKEAGYRCRQCGTKAPSSKARSKKIRRSIKRGLYETPICARRHLMKPLKRVDPER